MKPDQDEITFDFRKMSARERYKLMIGTVVRAHGSRWVTTVDPTGRINAAPFSFFNCLSAGSADPRARVEKTTPTCRSRTLRATSDLTEVFTVNIVSHAIAEAMHVCAVPFAAGRDELQAAGLTAVPGTEVASPWIKEAPAVLLNAAAMSRWNSANPARSFSARSCLHITSATWSMPSGCGSIPPSSTAAALSAAILCATIRDRFEMLTPTLEDYEAMTRASKNSLSIYAEIGFVFSIPQTIRTGTRSST